MTFALKIEEAIEKRASVILDTSILLDYLKATCEKTDSEEGNYKRRMLQTIIPRFGKIYITSYVLAEVCNLAKTRTSNSQKFLFRASPILEGFGETGKNIGKDEIIGHENFSVLGATDIAGMLCCEKEHQEAYLLMDDEEAVGLADKKKIIALSEIRAHYINIGGK